MGNRCGTAEYRAKVAQAVITVIDTKEPARIGLTLNSLIQILVGVFSVICGSLLLGYGWSDRSGPHAVSAGIWCGVVALLGGITGALSLLKSFKTKSRYALYVVHFVFAISLASSAGQLLRFSIVNMLDCRGDTVKSYCRPNIGEMVALSVCLTAAGCVMIITFATVLTHWILVHKTASCCMKSVSTDALSEPPKDKNTL